MAAASVGMTAVCAGNVYEGGDRPRERSKDIN